MRTLPRKLSLAAAAVLLLAEGARAQSADEVIYKLVQVEELNSQEIPIQEVSDASTALGPLTHTIQVGDPPSHMNALGEPAYATGFVNDLGTFWVEMNADNQNQFNDNGSAFARTYLQYLLRKDSDAAEPVLHFSGGLLRLADYGGGQKPLEASVGLYASVVSSDELKSVQQSTATLTGRGGTPASETFDYVSEGFSIDPGDYLEVVTHLEFPNGSTSDNVFEAVLTIPSQTIGIDVSGVCLGCSFYLTIEAFGWAKNPGGESAATAYLRDPLHYRDPAGGGAGGAVLELSGVTALPWEPLQAPEPAGLGLVALVAALAVRRGASRA